MSSLDFLSAAGLEEALEALARLDHTLILAGGTDLLVDLHKGRRDPARIEHLLDITRIRALEYIRYESDAVEIGPLVTVGRLTEEEELRTRLPLLAAAARTLGSLQIRNRATVGGNICNAAPCADLLPPLEALDAEISLSSLGGTRRVALHDFVTGPYSTCRRQDELLTAVRIPARGPAWYASYQRVARRRGAAMARVSLAVLADVDGRRRISRLRVVPGAATPAPRRLAEVEAAAAGSSLDRLRPERLGALAGRELSALVGDRWSGPYKCRVLETLVRRAFTEIAAGAEQEEGGRHGPRDSS